MFPYHFPRMADSEWRHADVVYKDKLWYGVFTCGSCVHLNLSVHSGDCETGDRLTSHCCRRVELIAVIYAFVVVVFSLLPVTGTTPHRMSEETLVSNYLVLYSLHHLDIGSSWRRHVAKRCTPFAFSDFHCVSDAYVSLSLWSDSPELIIGNITLSKLVCTNL